MELETLSYLRREFTRNAELDREQARRFYAKMREDNTAQETKEEREEKERGEQLLSELATQRQIAEFTAKLDEYDTATVDALMDNDVELKAAKEHVSEMLVEAHTLPDGRKVFLTKDGKRVFDQDGTEVKAEVIKPADIDPSRTRWETFRDAKREQERLTEERDELHAYQSKLDNARERSKDPKLTKGELDALDKELGETMPERVRQKAGIAPAKPEISAEQALENELGPAQPDRGAQRRSEPAPA